MAIDLNQIERTIGYRFENRDLLQQAFVRRSYSEEHGGQNNEVLEFIGDKALDLAAIRIMMDWFGAITTGKQYGEFKLRSPKYFRTKYDEGKFTDLKKEMVQKKTLAKAMNNLGFHRQLIMGKSDIGNNIEEQDSVKEDLLEAIVGAVAVDCDYDMDVICDVVESMIDFEAIFSDESDELENYVGIIQEWSQGNGYGLPTYSYSDVTGDNTFYCWITIEGDDFYLQECGEGISRAKSRMDAAYRAYTDLKEKGYIKSKFEEAVGEPIFEESVRQVNELYQKKLISKPTYFFKQEYDEDGNPIWLCTLDITEMGGAYENPGSTKKEAQRESAYEFLCDIMDYEGR